MSQLNERIKIEQEVAKIRKEFLELEHKLKMERLAYERENNRLFHERELERHRIKNADIQRSLCYKDQIMKGGRRE